VSIVTVLWRIVSGSTDMKSLLSPVLKVFKWRHCSWFLEHIIASLVKGRKSVKTGNREKRKKRVSYIKPAKKQIIIFPDVMKWIMNYYHKIIIF